MVLRRANTGDAGALGPLARSTFLETFVEGFGIPYPQPDLDRFLEERFSVEAIAGKVADPEEAWWIAEHESRIVAFASTGPCSLPHPDAREGHAELRRLYVDKRAQGLGLGTKLLAVALEWMDAHGDGPQWLGVWSGNLKAQKLYEAHGFRKAGEYKYAIGAWLDDEYIFRRG